MKILIVEQDIDIRRTMVRVLSNEGHQASWVPSGEDSIAMGTSDTWDLVIHALMPEAKVNGFQFVDAMLKARNNSKILITSGTVITELLDHIHWMVAEGAIAGFLRKPFGRDDLVIKVNDIM